MTHQIMLEVSDYDYWLYNEIAQVLGIPLAQFVQNAVDADAGIWMDIIEPRRVK